MATEMAREDNSFRQVAVVNWRLGWDGAGRGVLIAGGGRTPTGGSRRRRVTWRPGAGAGHVCGGVEKATWGGGPGIYV
jgi:hypothetical protein